MKMYAFDVDETLEFSAGPVLWQDVVELCQEGDVVGLCGNWGHMSFALDFREMWNVISFVGPMTMTKAEFLAQLKTWSHFEDYIMVGNDPRVFGVSQDEEAARLAGWRFLREEEFARGAR